jgi:dephospho-CoA kinase
MSNNSEYTKTKKIIGLVGFKNSGKNTVGDILKNHLDFETMSFAGAVKDTVSEMWGWPREMLEGTTKESREWREKPDQYWSNILNRNIVPRQQLQEFSTEYVRKKVHSDFWCLRLAQQLEQSQKSVAITDVRFPNEIKTIKEKGGEIWVIHRSESFPLWWNKAVWFNQQPKFIQGIILPFLLDIKKVHESERAWIGYNSDRIIWNNSTVESLTKQVLSFIH